jgi:iron(III) transport system substrate-binding protein
LIKQFQDESGLAVSVKYAKTPQLAATLLEEGSNTPADIFFAQDPGGLSAVEDMLQALPDSTLSQVPEWASSHNKKWVGLSGRARTVVYNTERLSPEDLPDDLLGFADPQWKDRIGWAPTNASFQTMVTAMRAVWGQDQTLQWLVDIQANGAKIYPKNTPIVAAVGAGEIDVGFVNHYYLHRFLAEEGESFLARNYHPRAGGPDAIIMVAGAGILSESANPKGGQEFINYLLSEPAQKYFASATYEYPLSGGATATDDIVPLSEINNPDLSSQDLSDLAGSQALIRQAGLIP